MKAIVIDLSATVAWVMEDERTPFSEELLEEIQSDTCYPIIIPLFWYEFRNMLISNVRRKRISGVEATSSMRYMRSLEIEEREPPSDDAVIELGLQHVLTGYDASYLALAISEGAILATNDRELARAALREGLELRTILDVTTLSR